MAKYNMYAYAHMNDVKLIRISSLGDFHTKITTSTKVEPGVITNLETIFDKGKKPFPFEFIWIPDKHIPASFTNSVKPGSDFSLDLRIQILEADGVKYHANWSFAQCKLSRSSKSGGGVKVLASCNYFRSES